jgi:hypothetical protein
LIKRGCAIGKGTREDRFVRKYIHKIDIKKRERDQEETWWQTDEYHLDPMLAFMSSDLNSIFAFNCHTRACSNFKPTLYSGKHLLWI